MHFGKFYFEPLNVSLVPFVGIIDNKNLKLNCLLHKLTIKLFSYITHQFSQKKYTIRLKVTLSLSIYVLKSMVTIMLDYDEDSTVSSILSGLETMSLGLKT